MDQHLLSVVIPMYNSEKYIGALLQSIVDQNDETIDIIIVDDGSIDNSVAVCNKYASNWKGIEIVSQANRGVSAARNLGLEKVRTPYVLFADSDDVYEPNAFSTIINRIKSSTVEWFLFNYKIMSDNYSNSFMEKSISGIDDIYYSFANDYRMNSVCTKVYSMNIIRENGVRFSEKYALGEDFIFNLDYCRAVEGKYEVIDATLYSYRMVNQTSATHSFREKAFDVYKELYKLTIDFLQKSNKNEEKYKLAAKERLLNETIKYLYDLSMNSVNYISVIKLYKRVYKNDLVRECISAWKDREIKCNNRKECILIYYNMYGLHRVYVRTRELYKRITGKTKTKR